MPALFLLLMVLFVDRLFVALLRKSNKCTAARDIVQTIHTILYDFLFVLHLNHYAIKRQSRAVAN